MDGDWYYATDGDAIGPITFDQLAQLARRGELKREHIVWTDGMAGWEPASSVAQLWPPRPPPIPPRQSPQLGRSAVPQSPPASTLKTESEGFQHIGVRHVKEADNWIVRHWQGELPLWKSYWLVGVLLSIAFGAPFNAMFIWLENAALPRDQALTIVLVSLAALTAVGAWQLVGIWRSAGNHVLRATGNLRRFWSVLARIVCILVCLKIATSVVMVLSAIAS